MGYSGLIYFGQDDQGVAGLDEAGRGCLAGPVVAAVVILPPDIQFKELNDSKKTKVEIRDSLKIEIMEKSEAWAVGFADVHEIDNMNILQATYLAMHRCMDFITLGKKTGIWDGRKSKGLMKRIVVDGNRFKAYRDIPYTCEVKGDGRFASIAAASILAKTFRDDHMKKLHLEYPDYGWDKNMGYGTLQHRKMMEKLGRTPHHRQSFHLKNSTQFTLFSD